MDSFDLRNYMLLEVPELSYIAVNVRGCRAYVQVRERVEAPEIISKRQPGNTVAAKDALITAVEPWEGEKQVLPGTTVRAGQLLIAGVVENDFAGARYTRGMGEVYGRTWYELRCRVPLSLQKKRYTGAREVRRAFLIGKKRVNLYIGSSISGDTCDKIVAREKWTLPGNIALPVDMITEELRPYTLEEGRRSEAEALRLADLVLTRRLAAELGEDGEVLDRTLTYERAGEDLIVTLSAECGEQIGQFVEIPKE